MSAWVPKLSEIWNYIIISCVLCISSTALAATTGRAKSCGQYSNSFSEKICNWFWSNFFACACFGRMSRYTAGCDRLKKSCELIQPSLIARLLASFVLPKVNFPTFGWLFHSKNLKKIRRGHAGVYTTTCFIPLDGWMAHPRHIFGATANTTWCTWYPL